MTNDYIRPLSWLDGGDDLDSEYNRIVNDYESEVKIQQCNAQEENEK